MLNVQMLWHGSRQKTAQNVPQIEYKISLLKLFFFFFQQMVSESGAFVISCSNKHLAKLNCTLFVESAIYGFHVLQNEQGKTRGHKQHIHYVC